MKVGFSLVLLSWIWALANAAPIPVPLDLFLRLPREDDFYNPAKDLSNYKNGEVYAARQIVPDLELKLTLASVHQIAYKTTGAHGEDSHSVATVLQPLIKSSEPKLFSYQFWEDSAQLNCSPSYTLAKGFLSPDWVTGVLDTAAAIEFALFHGYYVVVPDHEGPHSAFIEGYTQGQNGLDGIRAAISFLELDQNVPTALYGYSGGASATAWMANLHESYAPEINIIGSAQGGTPIDLRSMIESLDKSDKFFSGFIVGAVTGILNVYPHLNETMWPHMSAELRRRIQMLEQPNDCVLTEVLVLGNYEYHTQLDIDFWTYQPILDVVNKESLLKNTTGTWSVPKFPRYIFHAKEDGIVPLDPAAHYVKEQCANGANIQYVEWLGTHITTEFLGLPDALKFIKDAFDGNLITVPCGSLPPDVLTLSSDNVDDVLGSEVANSIKHVNGFKTPGGSKIEFDPSQSYVA